MALVYRWSRELQLHEIPESIRHDPHYNQPGENHQLVIARMATSEKNIGLWFEDGSYHEWYWEAGIWRMVKIS